MKYTVDEETGDIVFTLRVKLPPQFSEDLHYDEFTSLAVKRTEGLEQNLQNLLNELVKQ